MDNLSYNSRSTAALGSKQFDEVMKTRDAGV